jgi:hypothetical protein
MTNYRRYLLATTSVWAIVYGLSVAAAYGQQRTYETHAGVTYGHGPNGQKETIETHGDVTYGRDSNGRSWTAETHGGVTYVREKGAPK